MGVRLTVQQRESLDSLARSTRMEVAQLIRISIDALLEHVTASGGTLHLPLQLTSVWAKIQEPKTVATEFGSDRLDEALKSGKIPKTPYTPSSPSGSLEDYLNDSPDPVQKPSKTKRKRAA